MQNKDKSEFFTCGCGTRWAEWWRSPGSNRPAGGYQRAWKVSLYDTPISPPNREQRWLFLILILSEKRNHNHRNTYRACKVVYYFLLLTFTHLPKIAVLMLWLKGLYLSIWNFDHIMIVDFSNVILFFQNGLTVCDSGISFCFFPTIWKCQKKCIPTPREISKVIASTWSKNSYILSLKPVITTF